MVLEVASQVTGVLWRHQLKWVLVLSAGDPGAIVQGTGGHARYPRVMPKWVDNQCLLEILFQHHLSPVVQEPGGVLQRNGKLFA